MPTRRLCGRTWFERIMKILRWKNSVRGNHKSSIRYTHNDLTKTVLFLLKTFKTGPTSFPGHEIIRAPDAITYNALINRYCKKGKIGKLYRANEILKDMVESGIPVDEFTFNILIDGFCTRTGMFWQL
ncbi:hypothetical protein Ddye_027187 [Dipteronia dyeriana]|uniref:Pentatricopeptide repeat-containing protein n=1 Tax=Dipteronia dyeriana TaxID=168575 RepID=A0AAD9WR54_9ROSI|nr:hypothetical protein Ddye_027187 [Dipteronia dyeriana]